MKIKIIRHTVVDGRVAAPGEIVDVPEHVALHLLNAGRAEPAPRRGRKKATREEREQATTEG